MASKALAVSSASPLLLLLPFPVKVLYRNQLQVVLSPAAVRMGMKESIAQIAAHLLYPMAHSLLTAELAPGEHRAFWGAGGTAVPCFGLWELAWPEPTARAGGVSAMQLCSWLLPAGAGSASPLDMDRKWGEAPQGWQ